MPAFKTMQFIEFELMNDQSLIIVGSSESQLPKQSEIIPHPN